MHVLQNGLQVWLKSTQKTFGVSKLKNIFLLHIEM